MPATSMLSSVQKALRNLLIGDDEVLPARGCSRADGVAVADIWRGFVLPKVVVR